MVREASESEVAQACANTRKGVEYHMTLLEMDHCQYKILIELDNATAHSILASKSLPKQSKAIDVRFYWLRDREN